MLEQYTYLTFTGHTRGNAMEPFLWSGGPIGAPKGPQMAKNDNFGAIRGCCGSALAEQCGIKVEQVRAHPGRCNGTVSMVRGPVLKIWFGPPNADFWSVWSSQKARKFRQIQPTTKVRILCFEWKRICFQTRGNPATSQCIFSSQLGQGRTTLGMTVACIVKAVLMSTKLNKMVETGIGSPEWAENIIKKVMVVMMMNNVHWTLDDIWKSNWLI